MSPWGSSSGSQRTDDGFPLGIAALHPGWPEGRFNVSGMFSFDQIVLFFLKVVQLGFGCRAGIETIHGAPCVLWNGGRFTGQEFNAVDLAARLDCLYPWGVGCFPTFSNHLLEAGDLADANGNFLLDALARRPDLNGVIVNSELLSKYIAARYPSLRQVASVTKVTAEGGQGKAAYYNELGKRFYRYVVHMDDCQDPRLLDQLDRTKAEIILNEDCLRGCSMRAHHNEVVARLHKSLGDRHWAVAGASGETLLLRRRAEEELRQFLTACPVQLLNRQMIERQRNCNLTPNEVQTLYNMGFRHFKLQGRADNTFVFAYDLVRYTLEPDCAAPLVYKTLCPVICRSFAVGQANAR